MIKVKKYLNPSGTLTLDNPFSLFSREELMEKLKEYKNRNNLDFLIPLVNLPEVNIFPNNYGNDYVRRFFKGLGHMSRKYTGKKGKDFKPEIIDLNDKLVSLVDINSPKNLDSSNNIIGSYFIETEYPNMVGTPKSFYAGLKLGDSRIPIENFHSWMGFENGRLKVYQDRDRFNLDTLITPIRNNTKPITKYVDDNYDFGSIKDNFIIYQGDGRNARKVLVYRDDRQKAINDYIDLYKVDESNPAYLIQLDSGRYSYNSAPPKDYGYDIGRRGNIWGILVKKRRRINT